MGQRPTKQLQRRAKLRRLRRGQKLAVERRGMQSGLFALDLPTWYLQKHLTLLTIL